MMLCERLSLFVANECRRNGHRRQFFLTEVGVGRKILRCYQNARKSPRPTRRRQKE